MFHRTKSKGQIAVLLAIAVPALLAALALATDVAVIYVNWAALQKSADSSALAGAHFLPDDATDAKNFAVAYAKTNGILASEIVGTPTIAADNLSLTVNLSRQVPYTFAHVLGLSAATVKVSATAGLRNVPLARSLIPLGLHCPPGNCGYNKKQTYHLKEYSVGSGSWGALALGGSGASVYRQSMDYGYIGPIKVGDSVPVEPGNVVGPTAQAVTDRLNFGQANFPGVTADTAPAYDPRFVVVPLVDFSNTHGKSNVPITGFAQMWIVGVNNNGVVDAEFLGTLPNAPVGDPGTVTAPVLIR
jgi:hypothetical protein